MKLGFLALLAEERRLYVEQAATRRSLSPVILEKDFWVCWLLSVLFESKFAGNLVFKGGTSLSKVFGIIDRFVDEPVLRQFVGKLQRGQTRYISACATTCAITCAKA
ncbi:MAG: nucleotidyl transferase AbiEii/AbiGii toxin family protein [Planctomycetales bacterium]